MGQSVKVQICLCNALVNKDELQSCDFALCKRVLSLSLDGQCQRQAADKGILNTVPYVPISASSYA